MNNYELLYIIQNELEDDAKAAVVDKYSALVESLGGVFEVDSVSELFSSPFVYRINNAT